MHNIIIQNYPTQTETYEQRMIRQKAEKAQRRADRQSRWAEDTAEGQFAQQIERCGHPHRWE